MLETMRKVMRQEKGFTLIELLVVIAIIGILAAIAIPQFAAYKKSASDGAVTSALRNLAVAMEALFVVENTYANAEMGSGGALGDLIGNYGYINTFTSANVNVVTLGAAVVPANAANCGAALVATCWSASATNPTDGTGKVYYWDSLLGGAMW